MIQKIQKNIRKHLETRQKEKKRATKKQEKLEKNFDKDLGKKVENFFKNGDLGDFLTYLSSPKRIFWSNFLAGIAKGFGIIIGMTVVLAIFITVIAKIASVNGIRQSVIGEYAREVQIKLEDYTENTNYNKHFEQINRSLQLQNALLEKQLSTDSRK